MLYRDYSRAQGEWIPNEHGGNENLGAVSFLQELNRSLYDKHPGIQVIAEESTAWGGVTAPTDQGGLGFGYKWDMGWMHDTLKYMSRDPIHRRFHHDELTFRSAYQDSENFLVPLSHDEVVHGKGSLLAKMPGDDWQKRANLRLLLGYQWTVPGKKLLFMGSEFAVAQEWNHEAELDWASLIDHDKASHKNFVAELNHLYRSQPALWRGDCTADGFSWIIGDDSSNSVYAYLRCAFDAAPVLVVANFAPVPHERYRIGVPCAGRWIPLLESDAVCFGGSGVVNTERESEEIASHGHAQSIEVTLGPLAISLFSVDHRAALSNDRRQG